MKFTFSSSLKDAGLSIRVHNALLRNANIKSVSELRQRIVDEDDADLLVTRNFGTLSLAEVLDFLYPDRQGKSYNVCLSDKGEALADHIEADYLDSRTSGLGCCVIWGALGDVMLELNGAGEEAFYWPYVHILSTVQVADAVEQFMSGRGYSLTDERSEIRNLTCALFVADYIALELDERSRS